MQQEEQIKAVSKETVSLKMLVFKIKTWITYLFSKWYVFLGAVLLGGVLGFFYAKSKLPTFTATTTFVLESTNSGSGLSQYAGVASMIGVDLGGANEGIFQGENLMEFYKSRKMLEASLLTQSVSDSSKLLIDYYFEMDSKKDDRSKTVKLDFKRNYLGKELRIRDSVMQQVIESLAKNNVKVEKLDKKLSILKVDVTAEDEVFAKEFNEALVKEVNDFYIKTKTKKTLENIAILQRKTDSVRAVMNGNIASAAIIVDATPNLNPTRQAQRAIPTQRSQFSAETNRAILSQLVQNLELSKMALLKEAPLILPIDEPTLPLLKKKFSAVKGVVIGIFITFFIALFSLSLRKIYKDILED
ncbi:lipopolysaccharide biosynthesis protein [Sphingobacterium multivorum]|uniref:lipopolysaccharide biosynthesis protein n=1 Tax=Sphingobacterium multivorum TaxID=28454 RepID=UPI0028B01633|nr:lipopolysaccharide biosynthesis protein [Sphingobacterium multivorum]